MSQEKVDLYKKQKENRKKIMRREKWVRRAEYGGSALVLGALLVWFGMAVYSNVQANKTVPTTTTEIDMTAVDEYLTNLSAEE